jgi:CubicO group peptidase (beta-lactamase class C family)
MVATSGGPMIYSTGSTHLLSAILTQITGSSTWAFADQNLAQPMGFSLSRWLTDPQGIYFGGNDMTMTPRNLLAFGEMYLNRGRSGDVEVLPRSWVEQTFVARTISPRERDRFYGYGWWIRPMADRAVYYPWGYGGQFVFVVPSEELVVVTTSDSNPGDGRQQHLRRIYDLVEDHIVDPVARGLLPVREGPEPGASVD